jgi:hypothetical protein
MTSEITYVQGDLPVYTAVPVQLSKDYSSLLPLFVDENGHTGINREESHHRHHSNFFSGLLNESTALGLIFGLSCQLLFLGIIIGNLLQTRTLIFLVMLTTAIGAAAALRFLFKGRNELEDGRGAAINEKYGERFSFLFGTVLSQGVLAFIEATCAAAMDLVVNENLGLFALRFICSLVCLSTFIFSTVMAAHMVALRFWSESMADDVNQNKPRVAIAV